MQSNHDVAAAVFARHPDHIQQRESDAKNGSNMKKDGPLMPSTLTQTSIVHIIDDDPSLRRLTQAILESAGLSVCLHESAEEFLDDAELDQPGCIVLDLRMPGMGGLEATRRLRALPGGRRLVIVAISASVFGHHRAECIAAGADDFLAKPLRLERLLELLCGLLELEPVREESTPVTPPAAATPASLVFPPAEVLAPLLEQARRGAIEQVLEHALRIEAGDPRYQPFAGELRALAEAFQVKRLCQFLEERRSPP